VANVALLEGDTLAAGEHARVQLVFDAPLHAMPGDRFIVRNAQASRTVGGGRVLDPFGPARRRRTPERRAWLDALGAWLDEGRIGALIEQAPRGLTRSTLTQLTGFEASALALPEDVIEIAPQGRAAESVVLARDHWTSLAARIVEVLGEFHARAPDEQGADAARLRRMAAPLVSDEVWRAAVDALIEAGRIARSGPWLHLPSHAVSLDASEEALTARLMPLIVQGRYDPPWVRDLAREIREPEERVRALLRKLARLGRLYQIVRDLFYDRDGVHELARLVAQLAEAPQSQGVSAGVSASAFRDAAGLGRKRAIQILEFFDRVGYTRFQRDLHVLRPDSRMREWV
jgi:selenocysteine-specific elongation factor